MVVAVSEFNDAYEFEIANTSSKDIVRINGNRYYSKEQLEDAQRDAFKAARETDVNSLSHFDQRPYMKYPTFESYITSKQKTK